MCDFLSWSQFTAALKAIIESVEALRQTSGEQFASQLTCALPKQENSCTRSVANVYEMQRSCERAPRWFVFCICALCRVNFQAGSMRSVITIIIVITVNTQTRAHTHTSYYRWQPSKHRAENAARAFPFRTGAASLLFPYLVVCALPSTLLVAVCRRVNSCMQRSPLESLAPCIIAVSTFFITL
jgi:hypothetical protein